MSQIKKMQQSYQSMNQTQIDLKPTDNKLDGRYYTLQQKSDILQCFFCCFCEGSNQYTISQSDPNFNVSSKKGYIKEESDCLSRVFCVCNRPFISRMKLFNQQVAVAERTCSSCLQFTPCLQNQLIITNKTGRTIGIIKVSCWFCSGNYYSCADSQIQIISGENSQHIYTIQGNYCQKSILCPCFRFCYCPNIEYTIFDNLNLKVGKIYNIYNGCINQLFTRIDKFGIQFPSKADEDKKILITFAVMYLDYLRYQTPYFCLGVR